MPEELNDNRPSGSAPRVLTLSLAALAAILAAAALTVFVIIPSSRYREAEGLFGEGKYEQAAAVYEDLGGFADSRGRLGDCLAALGRLALKSGDSGEAVKRLGMLGELELAGAAGYDREMYIAASRALERGNYQFSYDCFSALGDFINSPEKAAACVERCLQGCADAYESIGDVPDEILLPLLDSDSTALKYRIVHELQHSDWSEAEHDENIVKLYSLDNFLGLTDHGFLVYRVYGRRYSSNGLYFCISDGGEFEYNVPGYRLSGYYGLYSKVGEDGLLCTGSDERGWTKQFIITFSEFDEAVSIYSFKTESVYTLRLERG